MDIRCPSHTLQIFSKCFKVPVEKTWMQKQGGELSWKLNKPQMLSKRNLNAKARKARCELSWKLKAR
jgi:hypothetical protein